MHFYRPSFRLPEVAHARFRSPTTLLYESNAHKNIANSTHREADRDRVVRSFPVHVASGLTFYPALVSFHAPLVDGF